MDIFVFDDHEMLRNGLRACFSDSPLYNFAGEAGNLDDAKTVVESYTPPIQNNSEISAIAIVDVGFSSSADEIEKTQGFELARFINKTCKKIKCVMYSSHSGQNYIRTALSLDVGAAAYVSKTSDSKVLIEAVNAVASGKTFIDPYLSPVLVTTNNVYDLLSRREREVLHLVQLDVPNEKISETMNISERTVENHLSSIYSKVNVKNRAELLEIFGRL